MPGCILKIQLKNKTFDFQPQFRSVNSDGLPSVWFELTPESSGFFGWLPYFNKQWPSATSKRKFKEFSQQNNLRTPNEKKTDSGGFLIKRENSSFGEGILGPFPATELSHRRDSLQSGEFIEEFISGKILKTLYWNANPVCVELYDPPVIIGNGVDSIAQLVEKTPTLSRRPVSQQVVQAIVSYQGLRLDDIPEKDKKITVDFRYGSALFKPAMYNTNSISRIPERVLEQIKKAGTAFHQSIPLEIRDNTAFSLDGILDENEEIWHLEMNCNPHLHPDIYKHMLNDLFSEADKIPDAIKPLHLQRKPRLS